MDCYSLSSLCYLNDFLTDSHLLSGIFNCAINNGLAQPASTLRCLLIAESLFSSVKPLLVSCVVRSFPRQACF
jgi:hypothetical protein